MSGSNVGWSDFRGRKNSEALWSAAAFAPLWMATCVTLKSRTRFFVGNSGVRTPGMQRKRT